MFVIRTFQLLLLVLTLEGVIDILGPSVCRVIEVLGFPVRLMVDVLRELVRLPGGALGMRHPSVPVVMAHRVSRSVVAGMGSALRRARRREHGPRKERQHQRKQSCQHHNAPHLDAPPFGRVAALMPCARPFPEGSSLGSVSGFSRICCDIVFFLPWMRGAP